MISSRGHRGPLTLPILELLRHDGGDCVAFHHLADCVSQLPHRTGKQAGHVPVVQLQHRFDFMHDAQPWPEPRRLRTLTPEASLDGSKFLTAQPGSVFIDDDAQLLNQMLAAFFALLADVISVANLLSSKFTETSAVLFRLDIEMVKGTFDAWMYSNNESHRFRAIDPASEFDEHAEAFGNNIIHIEARQLPATAQFQYNSKMMPHNDVADAHRQAMPGEQIKASCFTLITGLDRSLHTGRVHASEVVLKEGRSLLVMRHEHRPLAAWYMLANRRTIESRHKPSVVGFRERRSVGNDALLSVGSVEGRMIDERKISSEDAIKLCVISGGEM